MSFVKVAVWDLDGTIVDTETACVGAAKDVLRRYGKELSQEAMAYMYGRRQLDIYTYLKQSLDLPSSVEQLMEESNVALNDRLTQVPLMPGVGRLLEYFRRHEIRMVIATGTEKRNIAMKLKGNEFVLEFFEEIVGGDEVKEGKPDPEIFLLAAQRMNVRPDECIVFEDSASGAKAAKRAGMKVILVPSFRDDKAASQDTKNDHTMTVLASLLDFNPTDYSLPPFNDTVEGIIAMDPLIYLNGTVVKGFGRGARELGIRTANIDDVSLSDALSTAVTGIYAGWASFGSDDTVYKMVMSIGWNPFYKNEKKTAEAWLLHEFPEDFYGENIRLLIVGYLRPEADFTTVENLIAQIKEDGRKSEVYLDTPHAAVFRIDSRLKPHCS